MRIAPLLLMLAATTAPAIAQPSVVTPPIDAPPVFHGRLRQTELTLARAAGAIKIDGHLDDADWQRAAVLTGFSQYSPVDGVPAADSTEVLVTYSEYAIYFGIRAYETHGPVHATHADRDKTSADDYVQLLLDTFNDRRRAYMFAVNPYGIQSDGMFTDSNGSDLNPDFQFESKGRLTEYGYEVEIRIPFKSLRYQQTASQDWGINVIRRVQHSGHEQTWTPVERGAPSFLAQSGKLNGMAELKRGLVLDLNPVMTQRTTGTPKGEAWHYANSNPEFGGNVNWGVTPNLALNATIKPDFSQVEADVGQVVFDPRQAISFPEKRPFFLEGSENFSVPRSLIYTRSIVAPEGAIKLSGKVGGMNVGFLSALDDTSTSVDGQHRPLFNLMRLKRDLGAQSNIGVVYTDREDGDDFNRVAGLDTRLLFGSRYVFSGQVATSMTRANGVTGDFHPLFNAALARTGRTSGFSSVIEGIHPEFQAQSGFISRSAVAHSNFSPRKTFYPKNSIFEQISFSPILDGTWEWDRFVRGTEPNDIKMNTNTSALLRGGWQLGFYTWTETFKYPAYLYSNYFVERHSDAGVVDTVPFKGTDRLTNLGTMLSAGTPQFRTFSGNIQLTAGQDDNFDEWSSALILYTSFNADWRPSSRVRVNGRYIEQRTHRKSDQSLVRLRSIPRIKVEYQIARPLFLRVVAQHDGTKIAELRDDSRSNDPVLIRRSDGSFRRATAVQRSGFRADWLMSYTPNPGTVVFAGYGASLGASEFFSPRDLERTSDGFFVKLSYLFRTK